MRKYFETLILILIMVLVGGGIHIMQLQGIISDENLVGKVAFAQDPLNLAEDQLEQIGRLVDDYLHGYLNGSGRGTTSSEKNLVEEMIELRLQFRMVRDTIEFLYPQGTHLTPLILQFQDGFDLLIVGLKNDDEELLQEAHQVFDQIDC